MDQIVAIIRQAQSRRAPVANLADVITGTVFHQYFAYSLGYFVPVITLVAITTWLIWLGLGLGGVLPLSYLDIDVGGWPVWSLQFAVAVFVIGMLFPS